MKIAIFIPSLSAGGAERIVLVLADELTRMGAQVDIVLAHNRGEYLDHVTAGVQIIDLNASRMVFAAPKLANYIKNQKPDVILSTIELANIIAYLARLMSGVKVPWVIRQADYPYRNKNGRSIKQKFLFELLIRAYRFSDHVIAISNGVGKQVVSLSGVIDKKVTTIYNPAFYRGFKEKINQPVDEDWPSGSNRVVISVGRLSPVKDFPTLIKAFALVHQNDVNARLVILGEGGERSRLEKLIRELQLENFIMLPGFKENPFSYISKANVFVLSSTSEGFGNVLVEAMACGCPVVSTDCPTGPGEILNRGEYGYLVPVGDPAAMADAILEVLNGKSRPISREWLEQFKPEIVARQYWQVFENLLENLD